MADISLPSTTEKHVNESEMEPLISTPLQQIKRKRSHNDETVGTRRTHQRPRKKMYRPKVIGEGRPRKSKGSKTAVMAKRKKVSSKPKKLSPVTPILALSEPKKSMEDHSDHSGSIIIQIDDQCESDEGVCGKDDSKECIKERRPWTKKRTTRRRPTSKFHCLKIAMSMFKERLWGRFITSSNSNCMNSRLENTKRKVTGLRSARGKRRGSSVRPLPLIFCKRKRSSMVRRYNIAALSSLPLCNQLQRNRHERAVKTKKAEDINGNDNEGRLSKKENQIPNHQTSLASSKLNCSSRDDDDDEATKINESAKHSPTGLEHNDRCASMETPTKDVENKGIPTEGLAQMAPSRPASYELSNMQSAGALWEMGDLPQTDKSIDNSGQLIMKWLDIRHFIQRLRARSEKSPPEKDDSLTNRIITAHDKGTQEEETDPGKEKQIVPFARKGGKKSRKQEHDSSSVNGSQGAIVPHKPLNSTKKRELGRVYLDPRNLTVWNLIVQNESNSVKEKIDVDTEKWWANEREFFCGRISAFIARLHLILGDRRFSPWKGSVVDSVVGVFLTQNVSDHLSSSAYMSLAATFPLPVAEGYRGQEVLCIQQSTEELMSANHTIASQDFQMSSVNQSNDGTQIFSSICLEDDCETFVSSNLKATDSPVLDSDKSTFVQGFDSSQSSTSSCESNQENKNLESEEMDYRNQNPTSESLSHRDTTHTLSSLEKCHQCLEGSSQSKNGLEKNPEISNCCERTVEVGSEFTPDEKSQRFIACVRKVENQVIQLTCDANGKTKTGSVLSPIDDSSEKLDVDVEITQSQESVNQPFDYANDKEKKGNTGTQKYLEVKDAHGFDDEKNTEIPQGKAKKTKMKQEIDWDSLQRKWDTMRRDYSSCEPRSRDHMDSVDWEAVRFAEPIKIAEAIKERGQHNIIAGRIKEFLDRLARLHGCIDLEWLRNAPPNDVKEYLLEIQGLGLKSVECIRLLALQQVAFPVDINVGRIAVRLGWVPLEPLPEEVQIHLLETFPMMDSIQKYLWPRLCTLDQRTLYELHYQLITFGKVFCTKRKPNCNACPLRAECRHFASAFASARLALPGLAEKRIVTSMVPDKGFEDTAQEMNPASILHIEGNPFPGSRNQTNNCEPIIEMPQSPEPAAYDESSLTDIEDLCEYDSDDVPTLKISSGPYTTTLQNCMDIESKMLQDCSTTTALIPLHHRVASIPTPKLKHVARLRTEHQVYELPDTHPLLFELERREPNDPCPYLLCILSPGETIDSSEPPNTRCMHQELGELCTEGSCSSCNITTEQNSGMVRGTILIPCRTAMRGKFPLNGTYFQVNEVFADDESSKKPIPIPREWIWNLPRRITYFGTSTTTIFRGLPKEAIQYCFQKGFICVRGFNRRTRTPKRLAERLHRSTQASAKARANKSEDQKPKTDGSNSNSPQ